MARYWPEFAANGNSQVLVRHVLGHTSGVPGWDAPVTMEDVCDWDKSTSLLAAQAPWWTPGSASGYHALNYGHLVGEVVRRITGSTLGRFFCRRDRGSAESRLHHRPARQRGRARLERRAAAALADRLYSDGSGKPDGAHADESAVDPTIAWSPLWRRAEIGAANGHGNARSVARIQSIVANGG